jgi:DNA-binding FadR family transcriptional regulator
MEPPSATTDGKAAPPRTAVPLPVRRIRKAYEQVADQIQEMVLTGVLGRGDRLPSESMLAKQYGVSRATVREALRLLSAQNLIHTAKGASGGSFVTLPSIDNVSGTLSSNIGLLTEAHDVTLEEFLEARELIEVPAAQFAAERANALDIEHIHAAIPGHGDQLNTEQNFTYNRDFHSTIVDTCKNTLLMISARPVFSVLQTNLARSVLTDEFHEEIRRHHVEIADAVSSRDGERSAALMRDHLHYLRPYYERAWKHAKRG